MKNFRIDLTVFLTRSATSQLYDVSKPFNAFRMHENWTK
jgi:hypothetical protein